MKYELKLLISFFYFIPRYHMLYVYIYSGRCTNLLPIFMPSLIFAVSRNIFIFLLYYMTPTFFQRIKPSFFVKYGGFLLWEKRRCDMFTTKHKLHYGCKWPIFVTSGTSSSEEIAKLQCIKELTALRCSIIFAHGDCRVFLAFH